jgi:hypothetical protein
MIQILVEGVLTRNEAAQLAEAVNKRYSKTKSVHAGVGKRLISVGGVEPVLAAALTGLAIKIAEFAIALWKFAKDKRRVEKRAPAELSQEVQALTVQVFSRREPLAPQDNDATFEFVRSENVAALLENTTEPCLLTFSVTRNEQSAIVVTELQGNLEELLVYFRIDREAIPRQAE